jgi:diguanylate cyclase (GGDEF)-like protein
MHSMPPRTTAPAPAQARRLARRAWQLLHVDSARAIALAGQAAALAEQANDGPARAWAALTRGFHLLYFATPRESIPALRHAQACFDAMADRAGHILAAAGVARALWRSGRFHESLAAVLPLRDEGLRVLKNEQRGLLLNAIAGCYSAAGDSERAFAYMYQALREVRPAGGHGYDAVLHCNLAHELQQLGDCEEALRHIELGIARCENLRNPRLTSTLLINRVICLSDLGRAAEAAPDVRRVLEIPIDERGRGTLTSHFETLAIAAYRAGEALLGDELLARALQAAHEDIPDENVELGLAQALQAGARGDANGALQHLLRAEPIACRDDVDGLSLRVRCGLYLALSDAHQGLGHTVQALAALRTWQRLQTARTNHASRARYQAAALQTELLRLQHKLEGNEVRRRATEQARAELQAANEQLSRKVDEVQALQEQLRELAVRDALTGLFNRRHLNHSLPTLLALARRNRQPLAVAILDLDHFKSVNDQHGHAAGDLLLAAFGRLLSEGSRQSDVACRYGGEEFCLLMPGTNSAEAQRKISALLEQWRSQSFEVQGQTLRGLTFSGGVADSMRVPGLAEPLLRAADHELLEAKRCGRARVLALAASARAG